MPSPCPFIAIEAIIGLGPMRRIVRPGHVRQQQIALREDSAKEETTDISSVSVMKDLKRTAKRSRIDKRQKVILI